jgi:hypothetical protein
LNLFNSGAGPIARTKKAESVRSADDVFFCKSRDLNLFNSGAGPIARTKKAESVRSADDVFFCKSRDLNLFNSGASPIALIVEPVPKPILVRNSARTNVLDISIHQFSGFVKSIFHILPFA